MKTMNIKLGSAKFIADKLFRTSPILIAFLLILTPHIKLPLLPAIRMEQILVLTILMLELYFYRFSRLKTVLRRRMVVVFIGLILFMTMTMIKGFLSGYGIVYNDFFELIKVFFYFSTYSVARLYIKSEKDRKQLMKYIVLFIFIASLVAVTQYFNFFNMNELYVRQLAPTQFKTLVDGYPSPRVIGITGNPNFFALFASIAGFITFREFLTSGNWKAVLSTIYFFIIMNMTKSRTGFLFFVMGILLLLLMEGARRVKTIYHEKGLNDGKVASIKLVLILLFIVAAFVLFIIFGPESLTWRLKHGIDIMNDASFMTRVGRWEEYVKLFDLPHLIGVGPTKSINIPFQVDNEWLILLKEFGFVGTVFMVLVFVIPFIKDKVNPYGDLYFSVISAGALFMMTSVFVSIHQVMPLVMLLAAVSRPVSDMQEEVEFEDSFHH